MNESEADKLSAKNTEILLPAGEGEPDPGKALKEQYEDAYGKFKDLDNKMRAFPGLRSDATWFSKLQSLRNELSRVREELDISEANASGKKLSHVSTEFNERTVGAVSGNEAEKIREKIEGIRELKREFERLRQDNQNLRVESDAAWEELEKFKINGNAEFYKAASGLMEMQINPKSREKLDRMGFPVGAFTDEGRKYHGEKYFGEDHNLTNIYDIAVKNLENKVGFFDIGTKRNLRNLIEWISDYRQKLRAKQTATEAIANEYSKSKKPNDDKMIGIREVVNADPDLERVMSSGQFNSELRQDDLADWIKKMRSLEDFKRADNRRQAKKTVNPSWGERLAEGP